MADSKLTPTVQDPCITVLKLQEDNLFNGNLIKGKYKVNVNTIDLPAGTYFYTLKSKTQQQTRILTVGN